MAVVMTVESSCSMRKANATTTGISRRRRGFRSVANSGALSVSLDSVIRAAIKARLLNRSASNEFGMVGHAAHWTRDKGPQAREALGTRESPERCVEFFEVYAKSAFASIFTSYPPI